LSEYQDIQLGKKKVFLFDFDGVMSTGTLDWKTEVLGGYRILAELRRRGINIAIVASGSNWSTREAWATMRELGFMVEENEVWIATKVTAMYLKQKLGSARCLVIGEEGIVRELRLYGHKVVEDWESADTVVVSHDRFLSYEKLTKAIRALSKRDVLFVAVNKVKWYYNRDEGPMLSPGAIVTALEFQTDRQAVVVGKPSPIQFATILEYFGESPENSVMVGDVIESDLVPAKSLGMTSILAKSTIERWHQPAPEEMNSVDLVIQDVDDLVDYL